MRLVLAKAYRLYPELQDLTDAQQEAVVDRVIARHIWGVAGVDLVRVAALILGVIGVVATYLLSSPNGWSTSGGAWPLRQLARLGERAPGMVVFIGASASVALGVVPGAWLNDRFMRRAIAAQVQRTRCPVSGHTLIGAPRSETHVRCRCGSTHDLGVLGLVAADLGPMPALRTSCACGYALAGLPCAGGSVRCPECGKSYDASLVASSFPAGPGVVPGG